MAAGRPVPRLLRRAEWALEKPGEGNAAGSANRWYLDEEIVGQTVAVRVDCSGGVRVAVRHEQSAGGRTGRADTARARRSALPGTRRGVDLVVDVSAGMPDGSMSVPSSAMIGATLPPRL